MRQTKRIAGLISAAVTALLFIAGPATVIAQAPATPEARTQPSATPISDQELSDTQDQLLKLLRMSPTLTSVVARDPSLLSNQEYVNRNNPQLGQFLVQHPDIARNPEYYLFTHLESRGGRRDQALERAVWPEMSQAPNDSRADQIVDPIMAFAAFAAFLAALVWLIRQFLENRSWSRIFKLQSDVHFCGTW